jgi:hypothetical protein
MDDPPGTTIFDLPPEILIKIFDYTPQMILKLSQVCKFFDTIATTQIKSIEINVAYESDNEIDSMSKRLQNFSNVRLLKLKVAADQNIAEKANLCEINCNKITHLKLSEMSFLNPFFAHNNRSDVSFDNLVTLKIENSDLSSSSEDFKNFVITSCKNLKCLILKSCSGMDVEVLNEIGRQLSSTKIEDFQLYPTYSYFDMSSTQSNQNQNWTIDNLKTLSVRSKLVVMKKNFIRNMIGYNQRFEKMKKLELIAELSFGSDIVNALVNQFPNLETLALGKGLKEIRNQDFVTICNNYVNLKSLEFHFNNANCDQELNLRSLHRNTSITKLTLGLTNNVAMKNLTQISKCIPNLIKIRIILYYLIPSSEEFLEQLIKIFSGIKELNFHRIGMAENVQLFF